MHRLNDDLIAQAPSGLMVHHMFIDSSNAQHCDESVIEDNRGDWPLHGRQHQAICESSCTNSMHFISVAVGQGFIRASELGLSDVRQFKCVCSCVLRFFCVFPGASAVIDPCKGVWYICDSRENRAANCFIEKIWNDFRRFEMVVRKTIYFIYKASWPLPCSNKEEEVVCIFSVLDVVFEFAPSCNCLQTTQSIDVQQMLHHFKPSFSQFI